LTVAVSRALRRLFHIRAIEERQKRIALESAIGELNRLEHALNAASERGKRSRRLIESSARTGDLADRFSGLEESETAGRHAAGLKPRIAAARETVEELREEFLAARVERRQAETLIEETEARDTLEADRRTQQALDDWHGARQHREDGSASQTRSAESDATPRFDPAGAGATPSGQT
jgi:flagellar biosynthesis chaperone FliJ